MKILHLIDSEGFYGAETVLVDLVAEQQRQGLQTTIINLRGCPPGEPSIEAAANRQGLVFTIIPLQAGLDIKGIMKVVRYAKENNFDVLHCHGYKPNILLGLMPKWLRRLPVVTTLHGWCSTRKITKLWFFEQLDKFSLRFMDAVVVVNKAMIAAHPYLQKRRLNVQVVNNGIPLINFPSVSGLDQDIVNFCKKDGLILGAIGRLSKEKGFDVLLEALAELRGQGHGYRLLILGEGVERAHLEKIIAQHKLGGDVFLAGYRDGARNYIPLFDLFVMPSFTEGLPITLLEAMQADVHIVASAVGGIPEVLDGGRAGVLVNPANIDELVYAVTRVLENHDWANQLKENAGRRVRIEYSCDVMAVKYKALYNGGKSIVRNQS